MNDSTNGNGQSAVRKILLNEITITAGIIMAVLSFVNMVILPMKETAQAVETLRLNYEQQIAELKSIEQAQELRLRSIEQKQERILTILEGR